MKNLLNMNTAAPLTQVQQPGAPQDDGSTDPNQTQVNPAVRGGLTNLTSQTKAPVFGAMFK